jgi:hypothetical protein
VTVLADREDLDSVEDALIQLDRTSRGFEEYTVQSDDVLGTIAMRFNTTVDKICTDNDWLTATTIIMPGDKILIETVRPMLSVRTVEQLTRREPIPMPVRQVDNPLEAKTYLKVVEEGSDGETEVTLRITRVNGVQQGPEEIIQTKTAVEPVERVVEVGTAETTAQRRSG